MKIEKQEGSRDGQGPPWGGQASPGAGQASSGGGQVPRGGGQASSGDGQVPPGGGQVPVPPLVFRLDPRSGVPTYLQLVHQVEHALRLGYLRRGDQLPKVKEVVAALAINPNTVLKAYRDLEYKGLVSARPGQGTFIQAALRTVDLADLAALRNSLVSGWLAEAAAAGLDDEGITALFQSALRDFRERRGAPARARGSRRERPGRGEVVA